MFEGVGLLNKGSSKAPAAPSAGEVAKLEPVSSNALNVTRVGGLTALITGAGTAALSLFKITSTDPPSVRLAAYLSTSVIVAATLFTVAIIIAADIRARASIAVAVQPTQTYEAEVKTVTGASNTVVALDRIYDYVLADATQNDIVVRLPNATSSPFQQLTIKRTDHNGRNSVKLQTFGGQNIHQLEPRDRVQLYSAGENWEIF